MKHIILFFLIFCLLTQSVCIAKTDSTNNSTNIENITQLKENEAIRNEIQLLKSELELLKQSEERNATSISNQLSSASYNLTIFSILFAVVALLIGVYVTYVERKIVKISDANKELLIKNQKIKEEVEATNNLIQSDPYKLFLKIKREETVHLIDRLVKVPEDIGNIITLLLSRELLIEDFDNLKSAYKKFTNSNFFLNDFTKERYDSGYTSLFFQHFLGLSMSDSLIKANILKLMNKLVDSSFVNDILKSTKDFAEGIVNMGVSDLIDIINKFSLCIVESKHKNNSQIYDIFFSNLQSRQIRFEVFKIIESTPQNKEFKIFFGNLLLHAYQNEELTQSERIVFQELEELKTNAT